MLDKNFKNLAQCCVMSTPKIKEHMLKDGKLYIQEYIEQKKNLPLLYQGFKIDFKAKSIMRAKEDYHTITIF